MIFNPFLGFTQENQPLKAEASEVQEEEGQNPELSLEAIDEVEDSSKLENLIESTIKLKRLTIESEGTVYHWSVLQRIKYSLREGQLFDNERELRTKIQEAIQDLTNLRVYQSLDSSYTITGNQVDVILYIEDSWNLIPLPFALIDTAKGGFIVGGIMIWNNFAGTTTDLRTSYGYAPEAWWPLDQAVDPVYSDFQLAWTRLFWDRFGFKLSYRNWFRTESKLEGATTLAKYQYIFSDLNASWSLSMDFWPEYLGFMNGLGYSQSIGYRQNFGLDILEQNSVDVTFPFTGPQTGFSHGLGYSDKNWQGNFETGWSWGIGQGMYWNWEQNALIQSYSLDYFLAQQWDWFGFKWKVELAQGLQEELSNRGSGLRGVPDGSLFGFTSLNSRLSFPIQLIYWDGFWGIKNFVEIQIWPFIDSGIATSDYETFRTGASAGFDAVIYPLFAKSFVLRFTIGWDLFNPSFFEIQMQDGISY
jgi:hypothetical protein